MTYFYNKKNADMQFYFILFFMTKWLLSFHKFLDEN